MRGKLISAFFEQVFIISKRETSSGFVLLLYTVTKLSEEFVLLVTKPRKMSMFVDKERRCADRVGASYKLSYTQLGLLDLSWYLVMR